MIDLRNGRDLFLCRLELGEEYAACSGLDCVSKDVNNISINSLRKGITGHNSCLFYSVRNSPRQSANAEAYLHFVVFDSAVKILRQLNS